MPNPSPGSAEPFASNGMDAAGERDLVARAGGDADAFADLYRAHVDAVYRFLLRRSRSRDIAEEVTSATFERALRAIDTFAWRPGGLRPWLYRIAANELAGLHRDRGRAATAQAQRSLMRYADRPTDGDLGDIDRLLDEEHAREHLVAALDALSPGHQEVIALRYLAGISVAEAADALGCSRGALAVRCHRALAALRTQLDLPSPEEVG